MLPVPGLHPLDIVFYVDTAFMQHCYLPHLEKPASSISCYDLLRAPLILCNASEEPAPGHCYFPPLLTGFPGITTQQNYLKPDQGGVASGPIVSPSVAEQLAWKLVI